MKLTTLCYIEHEDSYLMLFRNKKENDINEGKYIGLGGHFLEGESPEECLIREIREESGLSLTSFKLRGVISFIYGEDVAEYMFLYTADGFTGELIECDEGELSWVKKSEILNLKLWEGDRIFLKKLVCEDGFFSLKLVYDREDRLVETEIYDY